MASKWRVAILGLGHWYSAYNLARALPEYPKAELVAVAWHNQAQRNEFANTFGIEGYQMEFGNGHSYQNVPYYSELWRFETAASLALGGLLILLTGITLFIQVRREEHALRQRVEDVTTQIGTRARLAPERVCDRPESTTGSPPLAQRSTEEGPR